MMQLLKICFSLQICCFRLFLITISLSSCAALDGVFPKFDPKKKMEVDSELPTSASVTKKQTVLSEENVILLEKIDKLEKQILILQQKQKEQRSEFILLQEQWEMNFVLLERSVEESLNSGKNVYSGSTISSINPDKNNHKRNKKNFLNENSLLPVENFSLLDSHQTKVKNKIPETREFDSNSNLDYVDQKIEAEEEPGFPEIGKVNLDDLEEPSELKGTSSEVLLSKIEPSGSDKFLKNVVDTNISTYSDPDLSIPKNPIILIRHPGVKKIYNQGMTALIQKNHSNAIQIFENFTKRFPNNLDSDNAFYWIGRSYFELNDLEKAEFAFRKVLTLYEHLPTSQGYKTPDSIYMLGKLQLHKNHDKRADYYFEEVIKRFPGSAAARNAKRELNR